MDGDRQQDEQTATDDVPSRLKRRQTMDKIPIGVPPTHFVQPRTLIDPHAGQQRALYVGESNRECRALAEHLGAAVDPPFFVDHVADADAAIAALAQTEYDVVFVRVALDLGAWRALARDPRLPAVPLIAVDEAGRADQRSFRRTALRKEGADGYLLRSELSGALLETAVFAAIERCRMRKALSEVQERFALAVRGSNGGVWEWVLETGEMHFSRRWRELLGYGTDDLNNSVDEWFGRVHPGDLPGLRADIEQHLSGEKLFHEHEHRLRASDGSYRWVVSRGVVQRDAMGQPLRMAGSLTDTSDYRRREEKLREESRHDPQSGLPRREPFVERLARSIELRAQDETYAFSVLLVDVDRFRWLSDSIGHQAADGILGFLARRILACVRPGDVVARLGGDKFGILLENLDDIRAITEIADRICQAAREPFELGEQTIYMTVSIGMTTSGRGYESADEIINDVGAAANRAKERGQDRLEIFDAKMRRDALSSLRLEVALRQAVERGEFELYYQPIVCLNTGRLVGFEALTRWQHPRRGVVLPAEFISVAEQTGLIVPIGRWAIHEAVAQLKRWQHDLVKRGPLTMSVNLSARQLTDPQLLGELEVALRRQDLGAGLLRLELTESVLIDNAQTVLRILEGLRAAGARIWVDDFGTGYSSLSYLHRFPVDGLKIDKMFVDVLDDSERGAAMVRTIVGLAQALHVDVIAEGIETQSQADMLRRLGCPRGQGFLYAEPLRAADVIERYG